MVATTLTWVTAEEAGKSDASRLQEWGVPSCTIWLSLGEFSNLKGAHCTTAFTVQVLPSSASPYLNRHQLPESTKDSDQSQQSGCVGLLCIAWKTCLQSQVGWRNMAPKKAGGDVTKETKYQTGFQNWCSCGFQDKFAQGLHRASPWESRNHIQGGAVLLISQRGKVLPSNQPCDFPKTGTLPAGRYMYCSINVKVQNREGQLMFRWHKINPVKIFPEAPI